MYETMYEQCRRRQDKCRTNERKALNTQENSRNIAGICRKYHKHIRKKHNKC